MARSPNTATQRRVRCSYRPRSNTHDRLGLGHFFQRLKRRKCHNVAVVATARKLAIIAWRLLTTGEPYRYAQPASTATKLANLRTTATGERRRSGNPRGVKAEAKLPGGSKTIRSLDDTYANEGLPIRTSLPPGEVRHLQETRMVDFVEKISKSQLIPRKSKPNAQTSKNTGRQLENTQSEKQFPTDPLQRYIWHFCFTWQLTSALSGFKKGVRNQ